MKEEEEIQKEIDLRDAQRLIKIKNYFGAVRTIEIALINIKISPPLVIDLYLSLLKAKSNYFLGNFEESFNGFLKSVSFDEDLYGYPLIWELLDVYHGCISENKEIISCLSIFIEMLWKGYKKNKMNTKNIKILRDCLQMRSYLFVGLRKFKKGLDDLENAMLINNKQKFLKDKKEWEINVLIPRSWAKINLNDHNSAIKDLEKVLERNPLEVTAFINLGYLNAKEAKYSKSLTYINKAINLLEYGERKFVCDKELFLEALIYRAFVYSLKEDYDKSFSDFKLVFKFDKEFGLKRNLIELYKENIFKKIPLVMKNILMISFNLNLQK